MPEQNEVPEGFRLESDTTSVGDDEYGVEFLQAESLDAILAYYEEHADEDPREIVRDIWNSKQKQGQIQSPKSQVREAQRGESEKSVNEAISDAQETTRTGVIGAPRGSRSGPTQKQAQEFGQAIAQAQADKGETLTQAELDEIREEYGV